MRGIQLIAVACLLGLTGASPAELPGDPGRYIEVDVLYTSDIHGHISPDDATFLNPNFPPPLGGGASAAAYIARVRQAAAAAGREVLLFDSGDLFQGTPVGMQTEGTAVVEWMNAVGYTAGALGNHDFDLGWENTRRLVDLAEFPLMGTNIVDAETQEIVPWVDRDIILDIEGIRIAILGYCTESTANMSFAENVEGIEFLPIHEVLPRDVERVRDDGADLVFALMHQGLPYHPEREKEYWRMLDRYEAGELPRWGMNAMEIAHTITGVDAIFGGHTHQGYNQPWEDPRTHTLVFEPYANGSSIGHVTMRIDRRTRSLMGYEVHTDRGALVTLFEEQIWPDQMMSEVIAQEVAVAEEGLDERVGETDVYLGRSGTGSGLMGFVVADAYREALNADFALQNAGGVRADIAVGRITERDLVTVSPFGNRLVAVEVSGELLRNMLEDKLSGRGSGIFISGGKVRYDLTRPDGDRIVEFTIGGEPYDPDAMYRLALTDYLSQGNSGMWRLRDNVPESEYDYTGISDIDALRRYIQKRERIRPTNDGRWVKVN